MNQEPATRKRIKEMEVMVAEVIQETPETTTLILFTGNDHLDYRAGHFLTIDPHQFSALERFVAYFEDLKGKKEPPRAYSLASAPHERHLAITIKEERYQKGATKFPPLLSPLLVRRTERGARLVITGFTGPYTLPEDVDAQTDHLVHLCAGSGGVPNFSILKHALVQHPKIRHTFVYSNKSWDEVIFRDELAALEQRHPENLRVVHTLTRERREGVRHGRVGEALLREAIGDAKGCLVFACGPGIGPYDRAEARRTGLTPEPRFLEAALETLAAVGVPKDRIRNESYG